MSEERTLLIVKPDGVERKLVGVILSTMELAELSVVALDMTRPSEDQVLAHYTDDLAWLETAGARAIGVLKTEGVDHVGLTGMEDPVDVGRLIRSRLVEYLCSGLVALAVIEGQRAVTKARKIIGATLPLEADPGSIRGRYCTDDVLTSFREERALRNLVHASSSVEDAGREIDLWFGPL